MINKENLICNRGYGTIMYGHNNHFIVDQLSNNDNQLIFKTHFSKYLLLKYNITLKEYYNICVKGDVNYVQKCKCFYCDKLVKFISFFKGYNNYCCIVHGGLGNKNPSKIFPTEFKISKENLICKRGFGEIVRYDDRYSIDQIAVNDGIKVSDSNQTTYYKKNYGITVQEYYNICVKGNINYTQKCFRPECNNLVKIRHMSEGYRKYCGYSCQGIHIHEGKPLSIEHRAKISKSVYNTFIKTSTMGYNLKYKHGVFTSIKCNSIHYRSSYELKALELLVENPNVKWIKYESIRIPYVYEYKRRYIPDFLVEQYDNNNLIIEVKPKYRINEPINLLKFEAGIEYAKLNNMNYVVWTEEDLFK